MVALVEGVLDGCCDEHEWTYPYGGTAELWFKGVLGVHFVVHPDGRGKITSQTTKQLIVQLDKAGIEYLPAMPMGFK